MVLNRYIGSPCLKLLLEYSLIEKLDSSGMLKTYDMWPQLSLENYEREVEVISNGNFDHIVFCGMGGSGAIGDVMKSIFSLTTIHTDVVKGYLLPATVSSNSLTIIISASGNTQEMLSILKTAKKIGCKTIVLSSGGKLDKLCQEFSIKLIKTPLVHSPRTSFPILLFTLLKILSPIIPLSQNDVINAINQMESIGRTINSNNLTPTNPSLQLANWIRGTPVIFYPNGLKAAAVRFKNSIQENAKSHAMIEDVIETCHNGIVSWERSSNAVPIMIQGVDDYTTTKERWNILKDYFHTMNIDFWEITSPTGNILTKTTSLIYLLDYASIYLALISKVDPSPIKSIDFIKQRL
jgi:glucose/mannose-6-phosphate isomerase